MRLTNRPALGVVVVVVGVLIVLGAVQLRRSAAVLTDEQYVEIARSTSQGQAYVRRFPGAPCSVSRWWDVTVNCDYLQGNPVQPYLEKFRVRIEPASGAVLAVEIQTNAP
jgi:cytochrome oxidase assembly protein ShyY1